MENILLVLAVSLDSFVASIAYGAKKIKIPFSSIMIINMISSLFLGLSIFVGHMLKRIIPGHFTSIIGFLILFLMGVYYLFESIVKAYLKSKTSSNEELELKLFDIRFIIHVYIDETKADMDSSQKLDPKEALYLGTALSLDSLTIGFGSSFGNINYGLVIILSMIIGILGVKCGLRIGEKIVENSKINLSWLAGIILISLAILKLI